MRRRIRQLAPDVKLPVPTIGLAMPGGGGASPAIQVDGTLAVCTDVGSYVAPGASVIKAVYIRCETPGTAGNTIVDIHLNGVTIFTVQANRPTLAWNDPDGVAKSGVPDVTALAENDVLTVEIDAVATGAEDLVVVIDVDLVVGLVGPAGAAGGAHNILDAAVHPDSALDDVTRGSIIVGSVAPLWDELPLGAAARYLRSDGADLGYAQIPGSEVTNIPAGGIAATDVQAAINELDTEKAAGEGHHTILPFSYNAIGQGTWVMDVPQANQFLNGWWRNTTHNDGDNISYQVYLDAGTYTILLFALTFSQGGIVDVDIDAAEVASFDLYTAGLVLNVRFIDVGNVIATSGLKTLKFRVDGKNALSTDHYCYMTYVALWRTA